jgi:hypothetical protein
MGAIAPQQQYLGVVMQLNGFDISNWTETDMTNGIWMALGFPAD